MKTLNSISIEPVSIQYDQTSNRLKDLSTEIQLKLAEVRNLTAAIHDDQAFEETRSQLLTHLETSGTNIQRLIEDREQIQTAAQTLDQTVGYIHQNIKGLRGHLDHYRLGTNRIEELQVRHQARRNERHRFSLAIDRTLEQ